MKLMSTLVMTSLMSFFSFINTFAQVCVVEGLPELKIKSDNTQTGQLNELLQSKKNQLAKIQEAELALKKQIESLEKNLIATASSVDSKSTQKIPPLIYNNLKGKPPQKRIGTKGEIITTCPNDEILFYTGDRAASAFDPQKEICVTRPTNIIAKTATPNNIEIKIQSDGTCPENYVLTFKNSGNVCQPLITEIATGVFTCAFNDHSPIKGSDGIWKCEPTHKLKKEGKPTIGIDQTIVDCPDENQPSVSCAQYAGKYGINATDTVGMANWTKNKCTGNIKYTGGCQSPQNLEHENKRAQCQREAGSQWAMFNCSEFN